MSDGQSCRNQIVIRALLQYIPLRYFLFWNPRHELTLEEWRTWRRCLECFQHHVLNVSANNPLFIVYALFSSSFGVKLADKYIKSRHVVLHSFRSDCRGCLIDLACYKLRFVWRQTMIQICCCFCVKTSSLTTDFIGQNPSISFLLIKRVFLNRFLYQLQNLTFTELHISKSHFDKENVYYIIFFHNSQGC